VTDDPTRPAPTPTTTSASRRGFLKLAGAVAATAAASTVGCAPGTETESRTAAASGKRATGFDRPLLNALGEVMLPASLGAASRTAAVDAFVAGSGTIVAEEQHGYGYAEIRCRPTPPRGGARSLMGSTRSPAGCASAHLSSSTPPRGRTWSPRRSLRSAT
jgi:hypothetical protein